MSSVVLGIDIGTTSVKVCLIDADTREELSSESKDTQSNIPPSGESAPGAHEQNVRKIVSTLYNCLLWLPKEYLRQVKRIGICGQMHGLVLWRHPAWTDKFELVNENISNLITWQDTRCDHHYLARLPLPDSHLKAYTGYGINTLLWLLDHQPDAVTGYTHAATIQDFIVAMLCDLQAPVMSNQNAASWGYFNCKLNAWNEQILRAHNPQFPLHLLPDIKPSGTIVGKLTYDWLGIAKDTPITVALGDLQCSVLATLQHNTDAIINISTSAQIAFIDENFVPKDHYVDETNSFILQDETNRKDHTIQTANTGLITKELPEHDENLGMKDTTTGQTSKSTEESTVVGSTRIETQNMQETLLETPPHSVRQTDKTSQETKRSCDEQNQIETPSQRNRIDNGQIRDRLQNLEINDDVVGLDPTINTLGRLGEDNIGYDEVDPILPTKHTTSVASTNQSTRFDNPQSCRSKLRKGIKLCCSCSGSCSAAEVSPPSQQDHIEHFPYFNGNYIAVGASMNGGNCLATVVCTLQAWFKEFGFNVPQNQIWSKLINAVDDPEGHIARNESDLKFLPTLLGDRHVIEESASILNITPGNLAISKMFIALCKGIIDNLHSIMSRERLHTARIDRIIGIGSCLTRNHILQHYVNQEHRELNEVPRIGRVRSCSLTVQLYCHRRQLGVPPSPHGLLCSMETLRHCFNYLLP
uniref:Sedoheptulokinase n=1 Tax=Cacopsylla melanoneura TaxID=428564 RepID=A0A8D9F7G0_9HEMI